MWLLGMMQLTASTVADAQRGDAVALAGEANRSHTKPDIRHDTPHILLTGAPNTFQILSIPLPDESSRASTGRVELVGRDGFTTLGTHSWSFSSLAGKQRVVGIIGIPANAGFGRVTGAEVRMSAPGTVTEIVFVDIDVSLVRALAARTHSSPLHARRGGQVVFTYELVNDGNAPESVGTLVVSPVGWTTRQKPGASASVRPNESVARQIVVSVPRAAGTGSFFFRLDLIDSGVPRRSMPFTVEVLDGPSGQTAAGPEITVAVAGTIDATGRGATATTASIQGAVFDSVRIDARLSLGQTVSGSSRQALSRVGAYGAMPSLALTSPSGRVALGSTGTSFSDLTGLYARGNGVLLDAHRSSWRVIGLGVVSDQTPDAGSSQPLLGVRADLDVGRAKITSSVSHLRGGELSERALDAAGVGASLDAGPATVAGEVARRRFAGGSGNGWSAEIGRNSPQNTADLRVTHAPGGSEAFARGADEIVATISQSVAQRLHLSASSWRMSDATTTFAQLRSVGSSLRSEYRVYASTNIAIEAHSTEATATTAGIQNGAVRGYGSGEKQAGAGINTSIRQFYISESVAGGSVNRTVAADSTLSPDVRSPTIAWSTTASWRGSRSVVEFQGRIDESRDGSGAVRRPSQFSLRGHQSVGFFLIRQAAVNWEVQQLRGISLRPTTILRTGLFVPVAEMLAVTLHAERNPLFATGAGRSPWVFALRVEHSTRVPMLRSPGTTGHVYRDLNGNRKRDIGEPGIDGAVVRRGTETAVTDEDGKYRLAWSAQSTITLDETSLPLGWIGQTTPSGDIAVGSSLSAEIHFVIAPRLVGEQLQVDLSAVRAIARDTAGREWVARMTAPRVAKFDALPPGTYSLVIDVTAVLEPLVPRTPLPSLRVTSLEASVVTVMLDPRSLRMWQGPAGPPPAPIEPPPSIAPGRKPRPDTTP
jgi:hypothetical protein